MPQFKTINLVVIFVGALSGVGFSLIGQDFLDTEEYLLVKTFVGGFVFSLFLSFCLDAKMDRPASIDFGESLINLTKPYNFFFIVGLALILAGIVSLLISFSIGHRLLSSMFVLILGGAFLSASWTYVVMSKRKS